ncbi:MAG: hypothetical protein JW997_05920 [Actinobacteria bacterium]|nr:hypothetical protein [Actinomycetota bacterium]
MNKITLLGLYSYAHPADVSEKRVKSTVELLRKNGIEVNFLGSIADNNDSLVQQTRRKLEDTIGESCSIVLVYAGWSESTGVLNIISDFLHLPIIILCLAGYKVKEGLIAPAAAAGASLLRNSLDSMDVKYRCIYNSIDEEINIAEVLRLINISASIRKFRHTKIASVGYACSNLYPFMYDGALIKAATGIHVDNLELLELKMLSEKVPDENLKYFSADFKKRFKNKGKIPEHEIDLLARYYIAASEIIEKNDYKGLSIKCGSGPGKLLGFTPCMLLSLLGDKINAICEGDVYGLLAQTIVNMLTGLKPTFLEIFEFYKESVLMASCGFAPFSLCKEDFIKIYGHDWGGCGGLMNVSQLKTGNLVVFNLFKYRGILKMQLFKGNGKTPEKFQEEGWDEHEGPMIPSLLITFDAGIEVFKKNIMGPHYIILHGNHSDIIEDYCYFADIEIDSF